MTSMKRVLTILILTLGLFSQSTFVAQTTTSTKFQGFLGTYHPYRGTAYGGAGWQDGDLMQLAFSFGENAIISQASYNGYTFEENIDNSCRNWDVNKVWHSASSNRTRRSQSARRCGSIQALRRTSGNDSGRASLFGVSKTMPANLRRCH